MCNGLEPIKKRFPFYPFLRQGGLIAWLLGKSNKASQEETSPPRVKRGGEAGSHVAGKPGPLCAGQMSTAGSLLAATSLGDAYCTGKGSDERKQGKHNPNPAFPTSCVPKSALGDLCLLRNRKGYINSKDLQG